MLKNEEFENEISVLSSRWDIAYWAYIYFFFFIILFWKSKTTKKSYIIKNEVFE